jgi:hypothetical protein
LTDEFRNEHLHVTRETFSGIQDGRAYATIERSAIQAIHLKYGSASKHPGLQLAFACALIAFGCYPIMGLVNMWSTGIVISNSFVAALLSLPLGLLLAYDCLRKQYHFEVLHASGREVVVLPKANPTDAEAISATLSERFGYTISHWS